MSTVLETAEFQDAHWEEWWGFAPLHSSCSMNILCLFAAVCSVAVPAIGGVSWCWCAITFYPSLKAQGGGAGGADIPERSLKVLPLREKRMFSTSESHRMLRLLSCG